MHNPYATPESTPEPSEALQAQQRWSNHRSRVDWLGFWNLLCGVGGLLLTAFIALVASNVGPLILLWLVFWLARSLAGIGMLKRKPWGRWLAVGVHLLLCLSGVASVVGGFGLWVLLSDAGLQVFDPRAKEPDLPPQHRNSFVGLLALLILVNWAVPVWFFIFVLGPMV